MNDDFILSDWGNLLPDYLTSTAKTRLTESLSQFKKGGLTINYDNFYLNYEHTHFLQGDVIEDIRLPIWDEKNKQYSLSYTMAVILSNTCDISGENIRGNNKKQCLFAPVVRLDDYFNGLREKGITEESLTQFANEIKHQKISNLIFLPDKSNPDTGIVALLDQVFWFPTEELNSYLNPDESGNFDTGRVTTMNHFGHYLFILKLSFHLCRLPEEEDRSPQTVVA